MQTTITHPETREPMPMITGYQYDQLNRLRFARSYENMNLAGNSWDYLETYDNRYFNEFVYDPNGNILNQKRHLRNGTQIEDLTYQYHYQNNRLIQNRLYHVNDAIGAGVDATDIDDMGAFTAGTNINSSNNYSYDEEGRLTKDVQEGIDAITWRVDGKVKKIARPVGSGKKNVTFDYDAMGNRIAKHTYDDNWMLEKSTYYVLDAQGNQMNIYEHEVNTENVQYNLVERNMYGSSRLGTFSEKVNMLEENTSTTQTVTLGYKYFELSNHLGNVLTVIKDIKIPIELEGDDEPFVDPGDAPYFNADGTIKFDALTLHPSHTCVNPGLNFQDFPSSSYPTFEDVNGDGNIDMKVRSEVPIYAFPTRLFFYTTPGETYTLNFDMSNWENVLLAHVIPINCGAAVTNGTVWYTPGNHNISFTAVSAQTEIKWFIIKQQALLPGELTLSNVSFTQGTGPFFSQPIPPPVDPETDISHYEVAIVSVADYSPFGVELDGRTMESEKYRYGFQNQEKDDEVKGAGNSVNYRFRMHDPRIGRFFAVDPLTKEYPWYTPYSFSGNEVLNMVELEGLEPASYLLNYKNRGKTFIAPSAATGQKGQSYFWKLASNADGSAIWWVQGSRYVPPKPKPKPVKDPYQIEKEKLKSGADNNARENYIPQVVFAPIVKEKSATEEFEDDLWNNGTIWSYWAYKANQASERYEGSKGLENFARDGLVVVNAAGQLALFFPGAQGAGLIVMKGADFAETAFDVKDFGWEKGLINGGMRYSVGWFGKNTIPSDFIGFKFYKLDLSAGTGGVVTEITESMAVDYLNNKLLNTK